MHKIITRFEAPDARVFDTFKEAQDYITTRWPAPLVRTLENSVIEGFSFYPDDPNELVLIPSEPDVPRLKICSDTKLKFELIEEQDWA